MTENNNDIKNKNLNSEKHLFFNPEYDYIEDLRRDYGTTAGIFNYILNGGFELIKLNKSEGFDKDLFYLDERLYLLSGFIMNELQIFAFRGNECFYRHFGFKTNNKNNGFYFCAKQLDFRKHMDCDINDFYQGKVIPDQLMSTEAKEELNELSKTFPGNIDAFKKFIGKTNFEINNSKYKQNILASKDAMKKYFNITSYDELNSLLDKYSPEYYGYTTKLVKAVRDQYTGDQKQFLDYFVNMIKNVPCSKQIKQSFIIDEGQLFLHKVQNLFCFITFAFNSLIKDCGPKDPKTSIHDCSKIFNSEFAKHLDDLGGWYELSKQQK